jgi:FixJ family two-component response regulator
MRTLPTGSAYVAVVDDDENLRRSFARLLRAAGMRPITYPSAEAFLADTTRPRFDCLVFDVQLPGMSGLKLQEQLSDEGNETEILYITAHDDLASREEAYAMGCAGYFRKSDSGKEVLDAIAAVVGRSPRHSED